MQKCDHCGWNIPDDRPVCPYCGFPVESGDEKRRRRFMLRWHLNALLVGMRQPSQGFLLSGEPPGSRARERSAVTFLVLLASVFTVAVLVTGLFAAQQAGTGFAQAPPPALILSGNIIPGATISVQGRNFTPGGTVTLSIDGHIATQRLPGMDRLALVSSSLSQLAPQTAKTRSMGTLIHVMSDGTFETTIQIDPHWSVGSSHLLVATDESSAQQAHATVSVPRQAKLVSCSDSTATNSIALGPVLAGQKQPVSAVFTLCTSGSGVVQWTATWDQHQARWLQMDPTGQIQAPLSKQIMISASAGDLEAGSYSAPVTFSDHNSPTKISLRVIFIVQSAQATECLKTSTSTLSFTATQGKANPSPQSIKLSNCGDPGSWSATTHTDDGVNWLGVTPLSGQLEGKSSSDIVIAVSSSRSGQGNYAVQVTFKLGAGMAIVNVLLTIQPSQQNPPCVSVAPQSLTFSAALGQGNPASQVATVGNCGPAGSWSASVSTTDGGNWLNTEPASGYLAANATQNVLITVSGANLEKGTYTGLLTFKIGSSMATVNVTFFVFPPQQGACLSVSTPSLPFTGVSGQRDQIPQMVTLTNCGTSGSWSASTANGSGWLGIDPLKGNLKAGEIQSVTVSASTVDLAAGRYNDTITFSISTGSGKAQATVAVSLVVEPPPPCIEASAPSLSFVATQNQSDPDPQTITLTNCGPSGFWSASTANGSGWLRIDPSKGNLKAGEMQDVKVSTSITHQLADQYNDTIIFAISTSNGTSQAMVAVSLRVQPPTPAQLCNVNGPDLGELQQGQSMSGVITFGNCGGEPLQWGADFTDGWGGVTLKNSSGVVAPGDTGQISVTATAGSGDLGKLSAVFSINSNGGSQQATVSVTVVPPPPPCLQITAVDGKQPSDSSNVTLSMYPDTSSKITVTNCGTDNGTLSVAVSTSDNGNWLSTDLQPDTALAGGGNQDITITVSTSAPINDTGTVGVTLTTSGGGATVMINISVISPLQ